jgi:hypothetical protein
MFLKWSYFHLNFLQGFRIRPVNSSQIPVWRRREIQTIEIGGATVFVPPSTLAPRCAVIKVLYVIISVVGCEHHSVEITE